MCEDILLCRTLCQRPMLILRGLPACPCEALSAAHLAPPCGSTASAKAHTGTEMSFVYRILASAKSIWPHSREYRKTVRYGHFDQNKAKPCTQLVSVGVCSVQCWCSCFGSDSEPTRSLAGRHAWVPPCMCRECGGAFQNRRLQLASDAVTGRSESQS